MKKSPDIKMQGMRPGHGPMHGRFAPSAKAKDPKSTLLRIVKIYMKWKTSIISAMILTVIASGISIAVPYYIGKSFNAFNMKTNLIDNNLLLSFLTIITVLQVSNWVISTINGIIMVKVSQKLVYSLREEFFSKLQRLPLGFFDTRSNGDTMSRITNDAENVSSAIAQTTTMLIANILTITGSLIVMLKLNWVLTFVVLLVIPLVTALTKMIATKSKVFFSEQQKNLGHLNGIIEENIQGIKMVKAFNRRETVMADFYSVNERLYESSLKAQIWSGYMMPLLNVINNLVFTMVTIAGGILSVNYGVTIGTVISFLSYSKQFAMPLNAIASMFTTIQSALAGAERVFEIYDQIEEPADSQEAVEIISPKGYVEFQNVNFSYNKRTPVLKDVSFKVNKGDIIAFVGETGSGKTTIVNLITRFYDTDTGKILIDGVDIKDIKRESLRRCFSVVLQDTCLFSGTILDNIRYSRRNASDEEVINAAKIAQAHEFISKLPKGYETLVSGSIDTLSQGERQLLAIARAVLSESPILILDEATSSVDTKTEKDIQKALIHLMESHTCFLIAHRLSTIKDADRIIVISNGRIIEDGNHQSLMKKKGHYYEMVKNQSRE